MTCTALAPDAVVACAVCHEQGLGAACALTAQQSSLLEHALGGRNVCLLGCAGTGSFPRRARTVFHLR